MDAYLRHLPNLISAARILLVVPIIWSLLQREFVLAIVLFVIAGASDGLDGFPRQALRLELTAGRHPRRPGRQVPAGLDLHLPRLVGDLPVVAGRRDPAA
jgi:hypothetical protein